MAYDGNQGVFLRISRREDELSDHHGEQGKVYSSRKGYHSFSDKSGEQFRATNVLHVPGLGTNLLSVSQLQGKGYDVYFIKEKVYVKHPSWKRTCRLGSKVIGCTNYN